MISTVTTATISSITTASMVGTFALIGILVLFVLLLQKELAGSFSGDFMQRLSGALNVGLFPLLIIFLMIVVLKVAEVLN